MGKLAAKVALITGGSSGIGLAFAKRFVAEAAAVFISGGRLNVWRAFSWPDPEEEFDQMSNLIS